MPYVFSRPVLRAALGESGPSDDERKILNNVTRRVLLWNEVGPYYEKREYDDAKPAESRGTEAVLNAFILASNDARTGKLSDTARAAFNNMWALQLTEGDAKGSWSWLRFGMEPWEASDSAYYGAAIAAVAVGIAPENYRSSNGIQDELRHLHDYLNDQYAVESTINHAILLWASTKVPGLVDPQRQRAIIREIEDTQREDGGWELSSLAWPAGWNLHSIVRKRLRADWTWQDSQSDGYATGLMTFVLQEAGKPAQDPNVERGLAWLARNQNPSDGSWPSLSLTKRRYPASNTGHFMRDAATAYAVLALSESNTVPTHDFAAQNSSLQDSRITRGPKLDVATRGH
jgi:squalene-hopene/tetraprenyl-beta-curcumene cyclase